MTAQIAQAIIRGYGANELVNYLGRKASSYVQKKLDNALNAGYSNEEILRHMAKKSKKFKTPRQRIRERKAKKEEFETDFAAKGIAALALGGAYAYARSKSGGAIRPSAILPPLGGQGPKPRGPQQPPQLPGGQPQAQLPYNPQAPQSGPNVPRGTSPQPQQPYSSHPNKYSGPSPFIPSGPTITPPYQHDPEKNIQIIKNIREDKRIAEALSSGLGIGAVSQILREKLPKAKLEILERIPGGFEQGLIDFDQHRRALSSEDGRLKSLQEFKKRKIENKDKLLPHEIQRFEQEYGPGETPKPVSPITSIQEAPPSIREVDESIKPRTSQVALENIPQQPIQSKELKKESFYVPNYVHSDEPREEFVKRKMLYDVTNKAAKALLEGKSFLDFPISQESVKGKRALSTAADVLRFIAGIPNIYDPLLDDEDKEELYESFSEAGIPVGLKPSMPNTAQSLLGEGNIYGAQLAPNLIWNLILTLEPKVASMVPPSIKGSVGKEKGGKMGTTEMRRFLTHSVYNVLSGKKLSSELADKIERISTATKHVDAIVQATKAGNKKKMEDEMEKLMNDAYFMEIMSQEIEDLILSKEDQEKQELMDKEDTKNAASLKAAKTRKAKKAMDTGQ